MLSAYCAAKHGVVGLTRCLAEEFRADGITVNAICPGSVDTEMLKQGMPGGTPKMTADEVARVALFLAARTFCPDRSVHRCLRIRCRRVDSAGRCGGCRCFPSKTWCCSPFDDSAAYLRVALPQDGARRAGLQPLVAISLQLEKENAHDGNMPRVAVVASVGELVLAQELPDGRFNLVVRGRARIGIDEELPSDEPYRLIAAHEIPDDPSEARADIDEADTALARPGFRPGRVHSRRWRSSQTRGRAQDTPAALANVWRHRLSPTPRPGSIC
jgi:hypothetical protein